MIWRALGWSALVLFLGAQAYGLLTEPDREMGHLMKILYVHVPAAWTAFLAFAAVFAASILYLWRRREKYDLFAASAAEAGVLLTGLTLVLGSIWGRPTWGVWWTWDPRLTTTFILFVIFIGYLALRAFAEDPQQRARWSAAVGILGFLNVPIVYMSVRWWRTIHQVQSTPSTLDESYLLGLGLNTVAFLLITVYLIGLRYRLAAEERLIEESQPIASTGRGAAR